MAAATGGWRERRACSRGCGVCGARLAHPRPGAVHRRRVGARAPGAAALAIARRFGDRDLEFSALALLGRGVRGLRAGRRGDDAARRGDGRGPGGEVVGIAAIGEIYCRLLSACEHAADVRRAEQWMAAATASSPGAIRAADLPVPLRGDPDRGRPLGGGRGRSCSPRSGRSSAATVLRACFRWSGSRTCASGRDGSKRPSA